MLLRNSHALSNSNEFKRLGLASCFLRSGFHKTNSIISDNLLRGMLKWIHVASEVINN